MNMPDNYASSLKLNWSNVCHHVTPIVPTKSVWLPLLPALLPVIIIIAAYLHHLHQTQRRVKPVHRRIRQLIFSQQNIYYLLHNFFSLQQIINFNDFKTSTDESFGSCFFSGVIRRRCPVQTRIFLRINLLFFSIRLPLKKIRKSPYLISVYYHFFFLSLTILFWSFSSGSPVL